MGYMSTLLSQLVAIRYENPIDTLDDMDRSGLPLLIPNGTGLDFLLGQDPRPVVQRIYNKSIMYFHNGSYYDPHYDDL